MSLTKFETSFPFPIVKVTTLIQHSEVSKPTGISYILLVLINESTAKKTKLSNLLIQFGVPNDLHSIFADEIHKLINELEIIQCTPYEYNKIHFSEYMVGNFIFTEKGKKVFKEELIPASQSVESKQELFFDPVHNILMDKIPLEWKIGKIESSILPNQLAAKFEYKDLVNLEEYLNSVKGKGIVVKKEEIITEVSIMSNEYFYTTYPVEFTIDSDNESIEFEFNDRQIQAFFEKQYDNKLISEGLAVKRKFKFTGNTPNAANSNIIRNAQLMLPEQYEEILSRVTPLIISKSNYSPKQTVHVINSSFVVEKINPAFETIHVYNHDKISAYIPVQVSLMIKSTNGKMDINLLVEHILSTDEKHILGEGLSEELKAYSIDHARDSFYIFKTLNEISILRAILDQYLKLDIEENITILKEIKDTNDISIIKDWFKEKTQRMYDQYFKELKIKSLEHQLAIGGWLLKYLNIPDILIIQNIIDSNPNVSQMDLFILLESLHYPLTDIFSQVNVLEEFNKLILNSDKINTTGDFSNLIKTIKVSINQLKELTGILSPHQFVVKDEINRVKFLEVYNGFMSKLSELFKFQKYSPKSFDEIKEYSKHFKYLNNLFTEEKNAASNPKSIDQKFVLSKINKNDYFSAVIYLFTKLEWLLKTEYKLSGSMDVMINELSNIEALKPFVSDLHQFRKARNSYIHPDDRKIVIEESDLLKWTNIVFKEVLKV